jgi:hypothetical protein
VLGRRLAVDLLLVLAAIVSTPAAAAAYELLVSLSPDRSAPASLAGASVSGNIYVFTSPQTGATQVRFWLDNPQMTGAPRQVENNPPHDFAGGTVATANPFDTSKVSAGGHTITAAIDLVGGGTEVVSATFTVGGTPALLWSPDPVAIGVAEGGNGSATANLNASSGTASYALADDAAWLTVAPTSGTTPATVTLTADADGLAPGTHTGRVTATAPGYTSDVLTVTLTVGQSGPPDQVHLAWVGDPATTLTVVWRTLDPGAPSTVQYRRAGTSTWQTATGTLRPSGTTGALHQVTLTGLAPATAYEYRASGTPPTWSPIFRTRTAPPRGPADFDAVYVADTGLVGRLDGLTTGTQQVVDEIAALAPLLVLPGGDYAYFNTDTRFATLDAAIDAWFNQMQPVAAGAPLMPTYGNHEVLLGEGFDAWAARFPTPSGFDGRRNFSFDVGDVHFVSIMAVAERTGLSSATLQWIEQDILAAQAAGQRWVVPYFHVSPFSDGENHPSNLALRGQLGPLFERLGVKLVISSHDQSYERTYPLVDVPASNTPTSTSLRCYTPADGVTWAKVSPGGKLSNKNADFSQWATEPPPPWTAFRDNSLHHFARLVVSAVGVIRLDTYGVVGDGTPPVIVDSFEYRLDGACPPEPGGGSHALQLSAQPDRSAPEPLDGATVGGNIYAFVGPATGVARVRFWLDDPQMSGPPRQTENAAPWDFAGTASSGAANPFDTTTVPDGTHTISALVELAAGGTEVLQATVTVSNDGAPPAGRTLLVSAAPDRSSPAPLDGSTQDGVIYAFVGPPGDIARVRFFLDDPQMSGPPRQTENAAPWDFAGTASSGAANPFDTTTVPDGTHTISALVELAAGGTEALHATFTVGSGGGPTGPSLLVSAAPDRSSPAPLDGSTRGGVIYAFVGPATGVSRVRFFVDDPQMSGAPRQTEKAPPFDLAGTAADGTAFPFDTRQLTDGPHAVTAAIDLTAGGSEVVHAFFTVANGTALAPSGSSGGAAPGGELAEGPDPPAGGSPPLPRSTGLTRVSIAGPRFLVNEQVTYPGAAAEGLLMNVRVVNAVFEDAHRPGFDPEANTAEFLAALPEYVAAGVLAFNVSLQGGNPSYEGALNSAFAPDGDLRPGYLDRVRRVIEAADATGAVVILGLFYQRQDQHLRDAHAVRAAVVNTARWVAERGYTNVLLEIANEYTHEGFDHDAIRAEMVDLIDLARRMAPGLPVSASGFGVGTIADDVAAASDYVLIHMNRVPVDDYPARIAALTGHGKPVVINEDPKTGSAGARAAETAVRLGASWGFFLRANQAYPFTFRGVEDDPFVYAAIRALTSAGPAGAAGIQALATPLAAP